MPVEIRELTIKVNVNQERTGQASGSNTAADAEKKEAMIQEAVEQVLKIMENKKER